MQRALFFDNQQSMKPQRLWLMKQSEKESEQIFGTIPELEPNMSKRKFAWIILKPLKWWMLATLLFVFLSHGSEVLTIYLTKVIIDTLSTSTPGAIGFDSVLWLVLSMAFVGLVHSTFWRCAGFFASHYTTAFYQRVNQALFQYIAQHNPGYFYNHFAGALATKVRNVADGYFDIFDALQWNISETVVVTVSAILLFTQISPVFGGIVVLWVLFSFLLYVFFGKRKRVYSKQTSLLRSATTGRIVDAMSNMLTITLFSQRKKELESLRERLYNEFDTKRASWRFTDTMAFANTLLTLVARVTLFTLAAHFWFSGSATTGDIVLIFTFSGNISSYLRHMGNVANRLYSATGSIEEGLETLLVPHGIQDKLNAADLKVAGGAIDFRSMTFAYPGRKPVLENFQLSIKPGEKVGLVGRSGAGKTTLMSLLLRFYDVTKGAITIDNQDLRSIAQSSLRRQVSMVPQEPLLFHRSIIENIRYGRMDATDEEVHEAARKALAHDFILALPEGYNTKVGERGVKLSGGQRQRIAIARAILKNAPILVLDEATASLDSESELAISKALHNLVKDKTVIAIAHRLSTLREMTRIIVMDHGCIVEDGSHDALMKQGGVYASLWKTQAGGFIQE